MEGGLAKTTEKSLIKRPFWGELLTKHPIYQQF
jgi:hypothetical protein